jgi:hypothetical protein
MNSPSRRKRRSKALSLGEQGEMVLREAVAEAIEEHRLAGHSISVLRDGKVVIIPAEQITPLIQKRHKVPRVNLELLRRTRTRPKKDRKEVPQLIATVRKLATRT